MSENPSANRESVSANDGNGNDGQTNGKRLQSLPDRKNGFNVSPGKPLPQRSSWFTHLANKCALSRDWKPIPSRSSRVPPGSGSDPSSDVAPIEDIQEASTSAQGEKHTEGEQVMDQEEEVKVEDAENIVSETSTLDTVSEEDQDPLTLASSNPIPVHPGIAHYQASLRETIPREADGRISQRVLFEMGMPCTIFISIFLLCVVVPRCAFFEPLIGGTSELEAGYIWRMRGLIWAGLVYAAVVVGLVLLKVLIWMVARVCEDVLEWKVVDERRVQKPDMTHKNLLVGGYLE